MADIRFSRSLYLPEAIDAAAEAYAGLATIEVVRGGDGIEVKFSDVDPDVADVIEDAFANHALAETITRSRALR
jgi:hypothetical protein